MRDDVGLGELAALAPDVTATETPLEILKEGGVEIDLLVVRAIERAHGGLGEAARRTRRAGEHDERRRLVGFPGYREDLFPLDLRASEHGRYEFAHLIGWSFSLGVARGGLWLLLRAAQAGQNLRSADQVHRIDPQRPSDDAEEDDGANAHAAGAAHRNAARSSPAPPELPANDPLTSAGIAILLLLALHLMNARLGRGCRRSVDDDRERALSQPAGGRSFATNQSACEPAAHIIRDASCSVGSRPFGVS